MISQAQRSVVASDAERFWRSVDKTDADGCWLWRCVSGKYGQFTVNGRNIGAHRASWAMHFGPIPDGVFVCHRCDNPRCVRPDHLFLGTHGDNMADMVAKGRAAIGARNASVARPEMLARGDRNGARVHPERLATGDRNGQRLHPERTARGERQGSARLTEAAVVEIRQAVGVPQRALARKYGISQYTVCMIRSGKSWKHVRVS